MPKIKIKATYTFECEREVEAKDYNDALQKVESGCGCHDPRYHSNLPYGERDYEASVNPVRRNYRIRKKSQKSVAI